MILPSRLTIAAIAGCAILVPLSIGLSWNLGLQHRDKVAAQKARDGFQTELVSTRDQLTTCKGSRLGLQAGLDEQNAALARLRKEAAAAQARAAQAVAAAQARAAAASADAERWRSFQPQEGESRCDAAFRLHQESLR